MVTANEHDGFHVVRCDEVAIVLTDLLCECLEESSRTSSTYYYEADLYSGWTDRVHVTKLTHRYKWKASEKLQVL